MFFKSVSNPVHQNIIAAEFRNAVMMAHHNAALFLSDHIVKFYHCARTTTACILNCALAYELIDAMKKEPYSLSADAYNDSIPIVLFHRSFF